MSQPAIEVSRLRRDFRGANGTVKTAIQDLSFHADRGELLGLLGPNGAGKTSTVRVLMTTLLPTAGNARVMGCDVVTETQRVRRRTGIVLGGDGGLYNRLSAWDNLALFADLYSIPYRQQRRRIPELLDRVGLTGRERQRVETYSRGMKQRLHIARGLLHDPDVVIMDEPSNGLDPVGARELRALVREQVCDGRTVLLTTHYMFEADELCDRVVVLAAGRKVAEGTPDSLKRLSGGGTVLSASTNGIGDEQLRRLRELPGVTSVSIETHGGEQLVNIHCSGTADLTALALDRLDGVRVLNISRREPTLEDAYVALVADAAS
ncbi:ABC transporter ATP-binding protein [Streptomyces sp. NPDC046727]|uniref:ABC transporter ATP-binding protein n=1 Tax=Streptomyces sp. NPDC046727 TaxID=3155373 RepID=UPI0033CF1EAA